MVSGDLRLTDSSAATYGSHFCTVTGPGMDSSGTNDAFSISVRMMSYILFDGDDPYHCMCSDFLAAVPPDSLSTVGGRICWKWSRCQRIHFTQWNFHYIRLCRPLTGSVYVSLQAILLESYATT